MRHKHLDVAIIGGGISGLSLAFYLEQLSKSKKQSFKSAIFEAEQSLGGKLKTAVEGNFILDLGPDSIATRKAEVYDLICHLGLQNEMIAPQEKKFSILKSGKLREVELGLLSPFPRNIKAVLATGIVSFLGKLRAGVGLLVSYLSSDRLFCNTENQSLAHFFKKKWGNEMYNNLLEPLFTGLYGGDLENISYRVFKNDSSNKTGKNLPPYVSLRGGIGSLINAIEAKLDSTQIVCGSQVLGISKSQDYWQIQFKGGFVKANSLVLAIPPDKAAPLLRDVDADLSQTLATFTTTDAAILSLGYKDIDPSATLLDKAGSGVIVPKQESDSIRGITLSSKKWPNRANKNDLLIRVFGRAGVFEKLSLESASKLATDELNRILGLKVDPDLCKIQFWPKGSIQCGLDHFSKLKKLCLQAQSLGGIYFLGSGFGGIGIADCIQASRELVTQLEQRGFSREVNEKSETNLESFPKNELAFS